MKEFIIFVCTDSTEIFFSKLRSAVLNYTLPSFFSLTLTVRGVSNKHCLLTFFIVTFPYGVSGQVWYLIVSIPDLCILLQSSLLRFMYFQLYSYLSVL